MESQPIHKDMPIAEILELVPDAVEIMLEKGLHCVGCSANSMESLAQGMELHGLSAEDVTIMVTKIEKLRQQQLKETSTKHPEPEDFKSQEITEGNKTYYKVAKMMINQKAYDAIHSLANGAKGLAIRIEAGGCAGFSMKYDYTNKPQPDEKIYALSDQIKLFINDFTFNKLIDSVVDFESGLHGSGLKFHNPNSKAACSCGTSIAF